MKTNTLLKKAWSQPRLYNSLDINDTTSNTIAGPDDGAYGATTSQ